MVKLTLTPQGLPIRFYAVTLCRDCHRLDAHMYEVEMLAPPKPIEPLTCSEISYQCLPCHYKEQARLTRQMWQSTAQPDFGAMALDSLNRVSAVSSAHWRGIWNSLPAPYDYIEKAALNIWYDNGMINAAEPEAEKRYYLNRWLNTLDGGLLARVNGELATLTDDQLDIVCCGEETEADKLVSSTVSDFLNSIFNEEYLT